MDVPHWLTPFMKQCFVATGACLSMTYVGMAMSFTAVMLPQLQQSGVELDDSSSWLASVIAIAIPVGYFISMTASFIFSKRSINMFNSVLMTLSWISIIMSDRIPLLLLNRILQGISIGISSYIAPILIKEYTSSKHHAMFFSLASILNALGVLIVHATGSHFGWKAAGLVCEFICVTNFLVVFSSPESPIYLADKGKFEELMNVFRWLRGKSDDIEMFDLIEERKSEMESRVQISKFCDNLKYTITVIRKQEFYKPMIILLHFHILHQWSGINILTAYTIDMLEHTIFHLNISLMVVLLDLNRIISTFLATFAINKLKMRTVILTSATLNVFAMLFLAGYLYFKYLLFDHPLIGIILIHILMHSVSILSVIPYPLSQVLFPLKYSNLVGHISVVFDSINLFINLDTVPYLLRNGVTFSVYSVIVLYCAVVLYKILSETNGRSFQDIEVQIKNNQLYKNGWKSMDSFDVIYDRCDK